MFMTKVSYLHYYRVKKVIHHDRKFYSMCKTVWEKHKLSDILSIPQHYALTAFISITSSLMLEWVNSGFKETPEEFMEILIKIVQGIPDNILVNTKDEN